MIRHGWLVAALALLGCSQGAPPPPDPAGAPPEPPAQAAGPLIAEAPSPVITPPEAAPPRHQAGACLAPGARADADALADGPRGRVVLEGKDGGRPPSLPDRLIRGKLLRCYSAALRERPELEGALSFSLQIGPQGRVSEVDLLADGDHLGGVRDCAEKALKGLVFEPPRGGARVEGRIVLRPAARRPGY